MPRRKGQTPEHVKQERAVNWKNHQRRQRLASAELPPASKTDADLIEAAVRAGKVTLCPPGFAYGALRWITGGSKTGGDPQ